MKHFCYLFHNTAVVMLDTCSAKSAQVVSHKSVDADWAKYILHNKSNLCDWRFEIVKSNFSTATQIWAFNINIVFSFLGTFLYSLLKYSIPLPHEIFHYNDGFFWFSMITNSIPWEILQHDTHFIRTNTELLATFVPVPFAEVHPVSTSNRSHSSNKPNCVPALIKSTCLWLRQRTMAFCLPSIYR